MTLKVAVEFSYLSEEEQSIVAEKDSTVNEKTTKAIGVAAGKLTEEKFEEILHPVKASAQTKAVSIKILVDAGERYFSGRKGRQRNGRIWS